MSAHEAKAEMLIQSSVHSVFDAFVNPETIVQFWLAKTSGALALGATVKWQFMVPGAEETVKVTGLSAPNHLSFDWSDGTHVEMQFTSQSFESTVVRVLASGFKELAEAINATEGFSIVLCDLKTLLESGVSANLVRDKARLIAEAK